jgi:putative flippase GtrA
MAVYSKLTKYIIVGLCSYLIEIATLYSLKHLLGFSAVASVAISFWIGFIVAFTMQKLITFKGPNQTKTVVHQLILYILLVIFNYLFTILITVLLKNLLNVIVIRTFAIIVITSWNFIIYNKYIFNSKTKNDPKEIA